MTFVLKTVETQAGFEPAHSGFADRRVTTSPLRPDLLPLLSFGSIAPAAARPPANLHDQKRCLCAPAARDPRIPIPTPLPAEPRFRSEDKDRLRSQPKSMETAACWSGRVEIPRAAAGNYPRPSTREALREKLLQPCRNPRSRPIELPQDNPDCGPPETLVHESLERPSGSLPPTAPA